MDKMQSFSFLYEKLFTKKSRADAPDFVYSLPF